MQIYTHNYTIMLILSGDPVCQILQLDYCHGHDLLIMKEEILVMPWNRTPVRLVKYIIDEALNWRDLVSQSDLLSHMFFIVPV